MLRSWKTYTKRNVDLLLWHVGASEVHTRLNADQALACLDHLTREVGGSPTSIPVAILIQLRGRRISRDQDRTR